MWGMEQKCGCLSMLEILLTYERQSSFRTVYSLLEDERGKNTHFPLFNTHPQEDCVRRQLFDPLRRSYCRKLPLSL